MSHCFSCSIKLMFSHRRNDHLSKCRHKQRGVASLSLFPHHVHLTGEKNQISGGPTTGLFPEMEKDTKQPQDLIQHEFINFAVILISLFTSRCPQHLVSLFQPSSGFALNWSYRPSVVVFHFWKHLSLGEQESVFLNHLEVDLFQEQWLN